MSLKLNLTALSLTKFGFNSKIFYVFSLTITWLVAHLVDLDWSQPVYIWGCHKMVCFFFWHASVHAWHMLWTPIRGPTAYPAVTLMLTTPFKQTLRLWTRFINSYVKFIKKHAKFDYRKTSLFISINIINNRNFFFQWYRINMRMHFRFQI